MKIKFLPLILLLLCTAAYTQELKKMTIIGKPKKMTDGELIVRRDANGRFCAAIKVVSDMDGFGYDSWDGIVGDVKKQPGQDIVFLTPTERVLEVFKAGYTPLKIILADLGVSLQPQDLWEIKIAGEEVANALPVAIRFTPDDAQLYINNRLTAKASTYSLPLGQHTLRIQKEGFQPVERTITVNQQNIFFEFTLERQPDAGVQISSSPSGATVYLDGVNLGQTPVAVFYKPGTYPIRIVKEGYVTIENRTLEIALPQTTKSYTLEENVGYLTVNTHSGASVYFNGEAVSNTKNVKLPPQLVRVKVTMPKAEPLEQQVVLKRNDRLTLDMYPEVQTATLQIAVTPFDANIELTGDAGEKYTVSGMKVFEDIPVGTYTIKVTAGGHQTAQETITLRQGSRETRSIKLSESAPAAATTDYGIEMVFVKGGIFTMGCTTEQGSDCESDEKPTRRVTVSDFYIGKYEVTQKQWREVMGSDPPELYFKGCDDCPVERVSWNDIQEFIKKLNQKTGKKYRLPTEAEWEYAARGGSAGSPTTYAGSNNIDEVGWFWENSGDKRLSGIWDSDKIAKNNCKTHPVGGKKPNELGIYDMSGNVWEWCSDWYGSYSSGSQTNPQGPSSGSYRVIRGGSWVSNPQYCRVANRNYISPDYRYYDIGFRLSRMD
jgi:formylglycine-generating enzyme required for sulfatase activity